MNITTNTLSFLLLILLLSPGHLSSQNDVLFQVESTSKGILIPSMTEVQRQAIITPSTGLLVYQNNNAQGFYFFNGIEWLMLTDSSALPPDEIADADGDTRIQVEELADEDIIRFDLGGTEFWRMEGSRLEPLNNSNSLFIGQDAGKNDDLYFNLNVFLGNYSGSENTSGNKNTAVGFRSFQKSMTGNLNTAIGYQSLFTNISGPENTALGANALLNNTTGSRNTAIGKSSLDSNLDGDNNTAIGLDALATNITGSNNTALGYKADVLNTGLSNATAIGYKAKVGSSNSIVLGGTGADAVNVGIGTTTPDEALHVVGNIKMVDGTQSSGKVLTSDNMGVASWEALPTDPDEDPTNEIQDLDNVLDQGNDAGGNKISNLMDPVVAQDAATKNYVDNNDDVDDADADPTNEIQDLTEVLAQGADANNTAITNLADPTNAQDAATKNYVDNNDNVDDADADPTNEIQDLTEVLSQGADANNTAITNLADPTNAQDAATKNYVDSNDDVDDADNDPTNELISAAILENDTLKITEAGTTYSIALIDLKDNFGDHMATENIQLKGFYLSNDGDDEGLLIGNDGSVGIGPGTPDPSAILDASSITHGFLPPRMTETQRDSIANPADGLMIFNTTTGCTNYYFSDGWYEACGTLISGYPPGTVHCNPANPTDIVAVMNPVTGETWMDRNLGANQVATSSTDTASYGDLYQWGRGADGHQCRSSATTSTLSGSDQPGHGDFILAPSFPHDWRSPQNPNLWQGVNGVNNPCPGGYRLPTVAELDAERTSWSSNNAAGAFASPLKLPVAGNRGLVGGGSLFGVGTFGLYWSSTVSGASSRLLFFDSVSADLYADVRALGNSVRCFKE